jgi:hypothetical protein
MGEMIRVHKGATRSTGSIRCRAEAGGESGRRVGPAPPVLPARSKRRAEPALPSFGLASRAVGLRGGLGWGAPPTLSGQGAHSPDGRNSRTENGTNVGNGPPGLPNPPKAIVLSPQGYFVLVFSVGDVYPPYGPRRVVGPGSGLDRRFISQEGASAPRRHGLARRRGMST